MSVEAWKKLPRSQQKVVLKVWESVLETVKFRAAGKGDFGHLDYGVNLPGILKPRDTPFDIALKALVELTNGTPAYHHPCPGCIFLGRTEGSLLEEDAEVKEFDLYFCNQGDLVNEPTVTMRWGDAPQEKDVEMGSWAHIYNPDSTYGEDRSYKSANPKKPIESDILRIAQQRAVDMGLI